VVVKNESLPESSTDIVLALKQSLIKQFLKEAQILVLLVAVINKSLSGSNAKNNTASLFSLSKISYTNFISWQYNLY
jgi:hypothetical protein